jgi:hypothetical protein
MSKPAGPEWGDIRLFLSDKPRSRTNTNTLFERATDLAGEAKHHTFVHV